MRRAVLVLTGIIAVSLFIFSVMSVESFSFQVVMEGITFILLSFLISYFFRKLNAEKRIFFIKTEDLIFLALSALLTTWLFISLPHTLFDDSGFTLRYLDNFKKGYFYTFNPADGHVFGISGFLNLLFCYLISLLSGLPSSYVLLVSNLAGIFIISFLLLKILRQLFENQWIVCSLWISIILTSKHLLNVAFTGIETPFHLSLILGAFYFVLKNSLNPALLLISLSVWSKLDAVSTSGVLMAVLLFNNRNIIHDRKKSVEFGKSLLVYFLTPLIIYLIITYSIFGSPLPQSAYAKVFHYTHPDSSLFPFLEPLLSNTFTAIWLGIFFIFSLSLFILLMTSGRLKKDYKYLIPFLLAVSVLILYMIYNPQEKMMWYYALPSFFISMQIFTSLGYFLNNSGKVSSAVVIFTAIILFVFIRLDILNSLAWMKKSMNYIENERILIGEYLGTISHKEQKLLSKHGHISRYFKGYVIDNSGLNSKLATDYHLSTDSLVSVFMPDFMINHAYDNFIEVANRYNYRLKNAWYDLTYFDSPNWLLFEKNKDSMHYRLVKVDSSLITGFDKKFDLKQVYRIKGKEVKVELPCLSKSRTDRFIFGAVRFQYPYYLRFKFITNEGQKEESVLIRKIGAEGEISRFIQPIDVKIPENCIRICIVSENPHTPVTMINPFRVDVLLQDDF